MHGSRLPLWGAFACVRVRARSPPPPTHRRGAEKNLPEGISLVLGGCPCPPAWVSTGTNSVFWPLLANKRCAYRAPGGGGLRCKGARVQEWNNWLSQEFRHGLELDHDETAGETVAYIDKKLPNQSQMTPFTNFAGYRRNVGIHRSQNKVMRIIPRL